MNAQRLADIVLILHAAFALFVVTGGFWVVRWRALMWLHIPAALWGIAVEFGGWICPLTPLENRLRTAAGEAPYSGDFIMHYVSAALYPVSLTRTAQVVLGVLALAVNLIAYSLVWRRRRLGHELVRR